MKVGDRVQIRFDLYDGMRIPFGFNDDMERYRGKFATIIRMHKHHITHEIVHEIDLDDGEWSWHESMFLPQITPDRFYSDVMGTV